MTGTMWYSARSITELLRCPQVMSDYQYTVVNFADDTVVVSVGNSDVEVQNNYKHLLIKLKMEKKWRIETCKFMLQMSKPLIRI